MASTAAEGAGSVAPDAGRGPPEGTPEPPLLPPPHPQLKMSPRTPDRASPYQRVGACFRCQQEGHWSSDCPSRKGAGRTQLGADAGAVDVPECPCGAGPCLVRTSKTEKNPGRKFFTCPVTPVSTATSKREREKEYNEKCNFFQWCDSPSRHQPHVASPVKQRSNLGSPIHQQAGNLPHQGDLHPLCQCGAGWCIVLTMKEGENAGRKYFSCPRKKDDERCNFLLWCDEFNLTGKCATGPMHQDLVSPPCGTANIRYPNCTCGAGRCRLLTKELGEYAGRKYFACPVKRGQGACNFFQWQDSVEGDYENGRNHSVGSENQHRRLVMGEQSNPNPFDIEPTLLNFDHVGMGESNAGSDKAHPLSPLEQQQEGHAEGPSDHRQPSLHNSSQNVSPKPGKCYRCGKEGHWRADCVESLPSQW